MTGSSNASHHDAAPASQVTLLSDSNGRLSSSGLSLRKNFSWAFIGNLANALSQLIMLLLLTRIGDASTVGLYGLGLALTSPLFLLVGMSLRSVQVTDTKLEHPFSDYLLLRIFSLMVGMTVLLLITSTLGYPIQASVVIMLLGLVKCVDGTSDIVFGAFQKRERMDLVAKSMLVKSIATIVVFSVIYVATERLPLAILAISVVGLVRLLSFDLRNLRLIRSGDLQRSHLRPSMLYGGIRRAMARKDELRILALTSLPVGVSASIISLNTNIPRYVLERVEGAASLGILTVLSYPLTAGALVISAVAQSSLPRLARFYSDGNLSAFIALIRKLLFFSIVSAGTILLVSLLFGEHALSIVFGDQYADEMQTFVVLALALGISFVNWFLNSGLHAMRAFRPMLRIQIISLGLQVPLALLVIPAFGLLGAAWLTTSNLVFQVAVKGTYIAVHTHRKASYYA